ncbi:MAG: Zn-ribbon domain-containing protein [Euryarchaeota archaeon]|nr:Zn-ribbon domain-containing protein [Euryarchaeota archaeon]MBU4139834.1 Zn-ribbon domain-containing protein [Euryarchaeota archaeon]
MPHKCTRCEGIFRDGAAIILNGCPKCGWNKFLYVRDETTQPAGSAGKTGDTLIPPAATQFIKEVDELLGIKPEQPEPKESKVEKKKEEIGERVESVRILSPGSYELNLDSIMKRDEIVMALKEDGTYIVHLPSVFQKKRHHER